MNKEYQAGLDWGRKEASEGKPCRYKTRPTRSIMQMGYYDGWAAAQNGYTRHVMGLSYPALKGYLLEQRRGLDHNGRKSIGGREMRKAIAAAKEELARRGKPIPPVEEGIKPEPNEKLCDLLKLWPNVFENS